MSAPPSSATPMAPNDRGEERAQLAIGIYLRRLRATIAVMATAMGGLDALVFTGGVGEHSAVETGGASARVGSA